MTTYVDSKIMAITSDSASIKFNGSYLSNLKYELGLILKDEPDIIHRQICLQSAQIPYSFYVVNYTCNLLKIDSNTYTIPVGNYTATTLLTQILSSIVVLYPSMQVTLNKTTGVITFSNTSNFTIYNNFTHSIGTILGFGANTVNASTANSLVATYPINLLGIKSLEVRSGTFTCNNISSQSGGQTTLLASIPVSACPFGMIDYKDSGNNQMTFYNPTLDDFDINIVDGETGEYVNFNNQNWSMTFIIHLTRQLPIKNIIGGKLTSDTEILLPPSENKKPVVPPEQPLNDLATKIGGENTNEEDTQPIPISKDMAELNLLLA